MTAKEFMSQVWEANFQIMQKQYRLEELRSKAECTTSALNGLPRSASPNLQQMESVVVEIVDLEKEIAIDTDNLNAIKQRICDAILKIEDQKQSLLLELRYLWLLPWDDIAKRMGVSKRHILRIHVKALCSVTHVLLTSSMFRLSLETKGMSFE